jgi:hypothetical protein
MSSSRFLVRAAFVAIALSATAALSGCTGLRPVYGQPAAGVEDTVFFYGKPFSRLDQVIYNDLRLRLGPHSTDPDAVRVAIFTTSTSRDLTRSVVARPSDQYEMTVTSNVTVTGPDGEGLFKGERSASADFQNTGQVLADNSAGVDAAERAAKALAESLRLTILSVLSQR